MAALHVYEVRRDNLMEILRTFSAAEIARKSGIAPSTISRYLSDPGSKHHKNISEENAPKIEKAAGKPFGWLDKQHSFEAVFLHPVAQPVSHPEFEDAPSVAWKDILTVEPPPKIFWTTLPDDAMAPRAPAGKSICFDCTMTPRPGDGVLIADKTGALHFRQYRQGAAGRFTAHAIHPNYAPLDSEADGLRVVAVLKAEEGRWG